MNWLYKTYFPYCLEHGIDIRPEDKRHICMMLTKIRPDDRKAVMGRFYTAWHQGMALAACASQRQDMGRKYANKYLSSEFLDSNF